MSIYALPGPLFKLVSNGISSTPKKHKDGVEVATSSLKDSARGEGSSSSLSVADREENPLHRRPSDGVSASSFASDMSDHSSSSAGGSSHGGRNSNGNVVIAVKEAKIDPARLIRSLSLDSKKNAAAKRSRPVADAAKEDAPTPTTSSSTAGRRRRRRSKKKDMGIKAQGGSSDSCCKCDPHEEAIKFEFSVSFNGREYNATRTLPRILQFRTDLIEEFHARRMWRERRRKRKQSTPPPMKEVRDLSDDEGPEDKSIPELPRLSEDAAGSSGFTMLNALLRPYGPALEHWLMKVIDIVPHDSQCLTQFLWEPLSGHAAASKKNERRRSSLSTLHAIQETEDLGSYDSDTDEYLLIH